MNIKDALKPHFVKALISSTVGNDFEIIQRPAAYAMRAVNEDERSVDRLIILPPHGYTADTINQMNSHDEAESATIQIKGAIRQNKEGWSKLKSCLIVASKNDNGETSKLNKPYITYDTKNIDSRLTTQLHSAGEPAFHVLRKNGEGFYHNLINTSDDWLMLKMHKNLRMGKAVDLSQHFKGVSENNAAALNELYKSILEHGDAVFQKMPQLIKQVENIPHQQSLPALAEMLYVHETGRHEACTAFAMILKIANKEPDAVTDFLLEEINTESIPKYYANQLIAKVALLPNSITSYDT